MTVVLLACALPAAAAAAAGTGTGTAAGSSSTPAGWHAVGQRPMVPRNSVEVGTAAGSTTLHVSVLLNPRDPAGLAALATAVSDPKSSDFRHFLARGQFAQEFGPSAATIASVEDFLKSQGLHPGAVTGNGLDIPLTTTIAAATKAFNVRFAEYKLPSGRHAYGNTAAPLIAPDLSNAVEGITGLDNLHPPQPDHSMRVRGARAVSNSTLTTGTLSDPCGNGNYDAPPNSLAAAYDLNGLYDEGDTGAGSTVALFELSGFSASDIQTYENCYGSQANVSIVPADPSVPATGIAVNTGVGETTGDIEFVASLAPKSNILVYESNNYMDVWNSIVSQDVAPVVSTSWVGGCEPNASSSLVASENTDLQEAAAQGQTVFAATGDGGSEDCTQGSKTPVTELAVQDPGSQPWITGVGGTDVLSAGPPSSEKAWIGSTGGISELWPMQSWQSGPGVINSYSSDAPCGASSGYCREVPDVSAMAGNPGYPYYCTAGTATGECNNGGWASFFGTSGAAPTWAAVAALTNASCAPTDQPNRLGFINPVLYQLAAVAKGAGAGYYNDITTGDNDFLGANGGDYPATTGYDLATGLGTPLGLPLAGALCHAAPIDVTVTGSETYGGAGASFTAQPPSLPTGVSLSGSLAACTSTDASSAPAGTSYGTITGCQGLYLTRPNAANYTVAYQDGGVTITPAPLTITASAGSMTYGGSPPTITPSYSGFVNGDGPGSLTPGPTCSPNATSSTAAGVYPNHTSCTGASDPNYTITYVNGTLTVHQAPLTITASPGTMTYGGTPPTITASYSGFVNGDGPNSLTPVPTCSPNATSSTAAGVYSNHTSCTGANDPNYAITYVNGTLTVNQAPLTITASPGTMTYGGAPPTITPSYSGFVNGDGPGSLTPGPTCSPNATSTTAAGVYANHTSCTGANDPNYAITYVNGTLTVNKAPTTLVLNPAVVVIQSLLSLKVTFTGKLTSQVTGAGIPNESITFVITSAPRFTCTALTNAGGVASCSVSPVALVPLALAQDYTGTFSGDANYLGSTASIKAKELASDHVAGFYERTVKKSSDVDGLAFVSLARN